MALSKSKFDDASETGRVEPVLDMAALDELLEVLGPANLNTALEKMARDVDTSLVALQGHFDHSVQRRMAHRLKGLMRQFGGSGAACMAEEFELLEAVAHPDRMKAFVEEVRQSTKAIRNLAEVLILRMGSNG